MKKEKNNVLTKHSSTNSYALTAVLLVLFTSLVYVLKSPHFSFAPTSKPPIDGLDSNKINPDELFSLVNDYRNASDVKPVILDQEMCEYAKKRSIEVKNNWETIDPTEGSADKLVFLQICPKCSYRGESLARNFTSELLVLEGWKGDKTNNATLIDPYYNIGCVKTYQDDIVVLELSFKSPTKSNNVTTQSGYVNSVSNIDCVGPDKVHFQTTKEKCDAFNQAWGKGSNPAANTNTSVKTTSTNTVDLYPCQLSYGTLTLDLDTCRKLQENGIKNDVKAAVCKIEVDKNRNLCLAPCDSAKNDGRTACDWAYTGQSPGISLDVQKYGECLDEISATWNACSQACYDKFSADFGICLNK